MNTEENTSLTPIFFCKAKVETRENVRMMHPVQASAENFVEPVLGYISVRESVYEFYPAPGDSCCTCEYTYAGFEQDNGVDWLEEFWDDVFWGGTHPPDFKQEFYD